MNKRGVNTVVAVVLSILIVIVAIAIIALYLLPNSDLSGKEDCFEVLNDLNFDRSTGYNCYIETADNEERTGFSVKVDNDAISGFRVGPIGANSEFVKVSDGESSQILRMLGGGFGDQFEFLNNGAVRTYVALGSYETIEIYPVLADGKICGEAKKTLELSRCLDPAVRDGLTDDDGSSSVCGNNAIEGDEVCDGSDLGDSTCVSEGFDGGSLACNSGCDGFNTNACFDNIVCGNGVIDPGETCDYTDSVQILPGVSCMDLGFDEGNIDSCLPEICHLNTENCLFVG